tara:strand:- start:177 stop:1082 length:906 start_codon:yes stop_codon:yes gene_type:complete
MDSQKVSIVIPVFNSAEFLEPALESLRVQSYANIAVLIGYRESTDDSLKIISKFCDSDDRFICIQQRGKGIANALNLCLEKVDTKYVARMDADDVAAENRIEELYSYLRANDLDIVGSNYDLIDAKGTFIRSVRTPVIPEALHLLLSLCPCFAHPSILFDFQKMKSLRILYNEEPNVYAEDYDLLVRLYKKGFKFGSVNKSLLKYRVLPDSLTRHRECKVTRHAAKISFEFIQSNCTYLKRMLGQRPDNYSRAELSNCYRLFFRLLLRHRMISGHNLLRLTNYKEIFRALLTELNILRKMI